jgi:hypothetical protein
MNLITDFRVSKYYDSTYIVVDGFTYNPYSDDVHCYYADAGKGNGTIKRITADTPIEDIMDRSKWKIDASVRMFDTMLFFDGWKKRVSAIDILRFPFLLDTITAVAIVDREKLTLIEEYEIALSVVPDFYMFDKIKNQE